ncbi:MAG: DUF5654 family protein [Methanomassiliicoccaceae archaeon]|nr:DUF5654 family protein [Methanomassiliicoccaceae archaeon]
MAKPFKLQLVETFATLMTAAFGMIAALAWNEAIKALVAKYFAADDSIVPLLVYAIVVTIIAVICIIIIARTIGKLKDSMTEEAAKQSK